MIGNAIVLRVRETPGGTDNYGDPIEGTTETVTLTGCGVAPRSSDDITDRGRQGVIVGLTLYAPHGTDLRYSDRIEVDGVLYEVDGEAGSWKSPLSSWEAGIEVALRRAQG